MNITNALAAGTANVTIPAGGNTKIVVKVKTRKPIVFKRTIRAKLRAVSQADSSKSAAAQATLVLHP